MILDNRVERVKTGGWSHGRFSTWDLSVRPLRLPLNCLSRGALALCVNNPIGFVVVRNGEIWHKAFVDVSNVRFGGNISCHLFPYEAASEAT